MLLLQNDGIVTVNVGGAPGARVSLRLKPVPGALDRVGGPDHVVEAVSKALEDLALLMRDREALQRLILGNTEGLRRNG